MLYFAYGCCFILRFRVRCIELYCYTARASVASGWSKNTSFQTKKKKPYCVHTEPKKGRHHHGRGRWEIKMLIYKLLSGVLYLYTQMPAFVASFFFFCLFFVFPSLRTRAKIYYLTEYCIIYPDLRRAEQYHYPPPPSQYPPRPYVIGHGQ